MKILQFYINFLWQYNNSISVAGLVLVTDAISAMGLEEGSHNIGQLSVEIRNKKAFIAGTNTLCGSIATMIECVKYFLEASGNYNYYSFHIEGIYYVYILT